MRRVIFNQKGGVGKSTIASNLAAISAAHGLRTIVIDLDPQGNSTRYLLGSKKSERTLADLFDQMLQFTLLKKPTQEFVQETPFKNLYVLASHPNLGELQDKLESRYKIYKLREALNDLNNFDAIFIDTPPALNFFSRSALIASDTCLIPFDCDDFSRQALYTLLQNIEEIRTDHNPHLVVEGIIINQFQSRASLPKRLVSELMIEGLPVFKTFLSASVKVKESHELARPLIHCAPHHKLTEEYRALYRELDSKPNYKKEKSLCRSSSRSSTNPALTV